MLSRLQDDTLTVRFIHATELVEQGRGARCTVLECDWRLQRLHEPHLDEQHHVCGELQWEHLNMYFPHLKDVENTEVRNSFRLRSVRCMGV